MSDHALQISTGTVEGAPYVQVNLTDKAEETSTILFTAPLHQAYQFFSEGLQVCLAVNPELDEIPPDMRA